MSTFKLSGPSGDPAGVQAAASRISVAADQVRAAGDQLTTTSSEARRAWSSKAQMLFSLLAEGVGELMSGAGDIATEFSEALVRFSHTLEVCQREVQIARDRLDSVWGGATYDSAAVAAIIAQAERARANAEAAARELSAKALDLMGGSRGTPAGLDLPGEANASFVSHAHSVASSLAAGRQAAASFDASRAQLEQQLGSVRNALVPGPGKSIAILPASSPLSEPSAVMMGPQVSTVEGSIMIKPGTGTGAGTVLLGPGKPLTTAPGLMIIPGSHASSGVVVLPAVHSPWFDQFKAGLDAETALQIAKLQAAAQGQPTRPVSTEVGTGNAYGAVFAGTGMIGSIISAQDQATFEAWSQSDQNLSGDVGDVRL